MAKCNYEHSKVHNAHYHAAIFAGTLVEANKSQQFTAHVFQYSKEQKNLQLKQQQRKLAWYKTQTMYESTRLRKLCHTRPSQPFLLCCKYYAIVYCRAPHIPCVQPRDNVSASQSRTQSDTCQNMSESCMSGHV